LQDSILSTWARFRVSVAAIDCAVGRCNPFPSERTSKTDLSRHFDWPNFGSHNIGTGLYLGYYGVQSDDTTLAFPVNFERQQTSDVPVSIKENQSNIDMLYGVYLQDIWSINEQLTLTTGVRWDGVSGIRADDPSSSIVPAPTGRTVVHLTHGHVA
jgi:outer membrane receptor protein involved in Fe transport